jgi:hypothetical protein
VDAHDVAYAVTQVVHNFGAVAVTAAPAASRWARLAVSPQNQRHLAWLALGGWMAQAASGATFGAISYATFARWPDIHGIAVAALLLKMACALAGFGVSALYLARAAAWTPRARRRAWNALLAFAATALCAAAVLRWGS